MIQNNEKIVFYALLGHLGTPKWTQKGTQMGGMYCLILKKVPKQIYRPILVRETVQNNQKIVFLMLVWDIWAPQMDPKRYVKACKWIRSIVQCLSLKISSYPNQ
jgi:hypothetical protein